MEVQRSALAEKNWRQPAKPTDSDQHLDKSTGQHIIKYLINTATRMGKKDKKKKDPEKKAALAAKKEAKADKAAVKRLQKEQDRLNSLSIQDSDRDDGKPQKPQEESLDSILASFRQRTKELETAVQEPIDTPFPCPPRGNFTLTLCPTNGLFYMVSVMSEGSTGYCRLYRQTFLINKMLLLSNLCSLVANIMMVQKTWSLMNYFDGTQISKQTIMTSKKELMKIKVTVPTTITTLTAMTLENGHEF